LVSSSIYTNQISSALYTGIKEYVLTENVLAQKVPGLASLIKLGTFAVNKTMKPLEAVVEKTIKAYIEANLGSTIRRSESSISEHFDEANIVELGDDVWASLAATRVPAYTQLIDGKDTADVVAIGRDFWLHFRKTAYFKAIYSDLVQAVFARYAAQPIGGRIRRQRQVGYQGNDADAVRGCGNGYAQRLLGTTHPRPAGGLLPLAASHAAARGRRRISRSSAGKGHCRQRDARDQQKEARCAHDARQANFDHEGAT